MFLMFMGLAQATLFAVLAFFIFYTATKAQGWLALFGRILGVWMLVLAIVALVGGAILPTMSGGRGYGMMWGAGQGWGPGMMRYHHDWQRQPVTPPKP